MTAAPTVPAVWQVVHAEASTPAARVAGCQTRRLKLLRRRCVPWLLRTRTPQGAPSDIDADIVTQLFGLPCVVVPDPISGTPMVVARGRHHTERTVIHSLGNSS